jgi:hypothetical protein
MESRIIALPAPRYVPEADVVIPAPALVAGETAQAFMTAEYIAPVIVTKQFTRRRMNLVQLQSTL